MVDVEHEITDLFIAQGKQHEFGVRNYGPRRERPYAVDMRRIWNPAVDGLYKLYDRGVLITEHAWVEFYDADGFYYFDTIEEAIAAATRLATKH